jgi:hypothetical protein
VWLCSAQLVSVFFVKLCFFVTHVVNLSFFKYPLADNLWQIEGLKRPNPSRVEKGGLGGEKGRIFDKKNAFLYLKGNPWELCNMRLCKRSWYHILRTKQSKAHFHSVSNISNLHKICIIATLGPILEFQPSWKSCKSQLARWGHEVALLSPGSSQPSPYLGISNENLYLSNDWTDHLQILNLCLEDKTKIELDCS